MKYLSILFMLLISGCTSQSFGDAVTDQVFEKATGKEYSRNSSQCPTIQRQCNGTYEEWEHRNGQKGCACN